MRKNPYSKILRIKLKKSHLNNVPKSYLTKKKKNTMQSEAIDSNLHESISICMHVFVPIKP